MTTPKGAPGNRSRVWTESLVHQACRDLIKLDKRPTVSRVRHHLNITQGSDSTVQRYIRSFRETNPSLETEKTPSPPEPFMNALNGLWVEAISLSEANIESERRQIQEAKAALEEEAKDIEDRLRRSELEKAESTSIIERQAKEVRDLIDLVADQKHTIAQLAEDRDDQSRKLTAEKERGVKLEGDIESLKEQLTKQEQRQDKMAEAIGRAQQMADELVDARTRQIMSLLSAELDKDAFERIEPKLNDLWKR